jgi:hypothetical protein
MGAKAFYRKISAEDDETAFYNAYQDALEENGHRDGYSGDLNSKEGYIVESAPPGIDVVSWIDALCKGLLPESLQMRSLEFNRQHQIYNNKFGPTLCFMVPPENKDQRLKEYIFIGLAPE